MKYNLLFVDAKIENLELLKEAFIKNHAVYMATSGLEALDIVYNNDIDLIICDQDIPDIDGVELLRRTVKNYPEIIRILLTGSVDINKLITAINETKIHRYIRKPFVMEELELIVAKALGIYQLHIDTQELALDLKEMFSGTINAITEALDAKDSFTFGRSKRVTYYILKTGQYLNIADAELSELELAGLLHDIGMIGISESLLNKPGNLTYEEYENVKKHVVLGVKILEDIKQLGSVVKIIAAHHERYDGKGYPYGLKGEEIPIGARIIAIADAYDGMASERAYRKGLPHEIAIEEIKKGSGSQFDPQAVEGFISIIDEANNQLNSINKKSINLNHST